MNVDDLIKTTKVSINDNVRENVTLEETRNEIENPPLKKQKLDHLLSQDENPFTSTQLRKALSMLSKRFIKNQELRIKYKDVPEKFMESEVLVNDCIYSISPMCGIYSLYPTFVESGGVDLVIKLIGHENSDILVSSIKFVCDLVDFDQDLCDSVENFDSLINKLEKLNIMSVLLNCLNSLDDKDPDECNAVYKCLEIIESLIEYKDSFVTITCQQHVVKWLVKKLRSRSMNENNKSYVAELLAILLHADPLVSKTINNFKGINSLLYCTSIFQRRNPKSTIEQELMLNVFNCLCAASIDADNRKCFLKEEGIELMILMIREKRQSRVGALKVLNHVCSGQEGVECCERFVKTLGLRTIFPLFISTPVDKYMSQNELEEHIYGIVCSLLKNTQGTYKNRVHDKFCENKFEKVERLVQIYVEYKKTYVSRQEALVDSQSNNLDYLTSLELGLFTLQQLIIILTILLTSGDNGMVKKIKDLFKLYKCDIKYLERILVEYGSKLALDEGEDNWIERKFTDNLVLEIGYIDL